MSRFRKIISQILFYATLLLIVAATVFFVLQKRSGQPLFLFDRTLLWVQTGSMQPTIAARSYILVERSPERELTVGDVIVFLCRDSSSPVCGQYVTHRIVEQTAEGYKTKGDSPASFVDPWTVSPSDILGVYERNLPCMTAMGRVFSTPAGMVIVFAIFFAVCGFLVVPSVVATLKREEKAALSDEEFDELVQKELRRLEEEGHAPQENIGSGK